ncbi:tetratricopeptide repeat protein [Hyalangium rubrum]|uniref:Tetratricopeptide repeat protein n=1 Tax=Hyalangium rubrum TaxID=3103134 RepID=A0ABU5H6Q4_9BACT|nr:tetratricopeptide repeat protein [Hyalangium sp. s54d21]MDY7228986.1 tetratricopeptide repeat protein [Hyalangium sp. s54d21]
MAKSMVERYEQLLLQDPTSAVFVELAKALLEKGEPARTIEVCEKGISHHPNSVIGRVLWGKALLHLGKPAQAMEQFDQAIAVDKENAHAYNLISEVLVQRGLFRSALPILRKAAALQPNDGRVRLWLDQTQQALSGGPPPVMADLPGLTSNALAPKPQEEEEPPAPPPELRQPESVEVKQAETPQVARAEAAPAAPVRRAEAPPPPPPEEREESTPAVAAPPPPPSEEEAPRKSPPEKVKVVYFYPRSASKLTDEEDTLPPGQTREGLMQGMPPPPPEDGDFDPGQEEVTGVRKLTDLWRAPTAPAGLLPDVDLPEGQEPLEERTAPPVPDEEFQASEAEPPPGAGGLLGDLPPPEEEDDLAAIPSAARVSDTARTSPRPRSAAAAVAKRALLDEIPDAAEPPVPHAVRTTASSEADTAAIAAAYEKELREKHAKSAAKPSFISRLGVKHAVGVVGVLVLMVGIVAFVVIRSRQGGKTLAEVLDRAERAISVDTRSSLREALGLLERAREMDDGSSRAWALTAYAHALLYADHGSAFESRQQTLSALEYPGVRAEHVGLSLASDVLVADDKARATTRRALLESKDDSPELNTVAGSVLLEDKQPQKAVERFKLAVNSPRPVRALVQLGRYYQDFGDPTNALEMYSLARKASPEHPLARIGMAENQLELGQELEAALFDMQGLSADAELPEATRTRLQLVQGRLLTELGRYDEARNLLASGTKGPLAFEFQLAVGDASRAGGKLEEAQQSYEAALKLQPKSEEAREGLGRTLLDRDRAKEALARLEGDSGRRVALVRAAAYARLEDWKRVRSELGKTQVNNRYPPEAVGYLAMADTMEGNGEQARDALEKAVNAVKRPRTELRVALGQVYWRLRAPDKAQAQFEEAMKDPRDYEAPCALGRLLLSRGVPDIALKPLTQAVTRNPFHGEARDALGRALLALGRTEEGFQQFEVWKNTHAESAAAQKGYALALFHTGKRQEAAEVAGRAVKLDASDAEAHRVRAVILFTNGDAKGGFSALEKANKLDPRDAETFCEIAHAFLRQDKAEAAGAAFEAARREGPDASCGMVGQHYADLSGGRVAAKALDGLADKAPTVWDKAFAQTAKARVLLEAGALKEARTAAEAAVKLAPFNGRAHLALGLVALRQRQEEPAMAALNKAVELEPAHGMAHLALADALSRKTEELPRAIQEYETFLSLAGSSEEAKRVKKALPNLKKRVK